MRIDLKFILGWTGIMLLGQVVFNIITFTWVWNYEFTSFWIVTYMGIIPLALLFKCREEKEKYDI